MRFNALIINSLQVMQNENVGPFSQYTLWFLIPDPGSPCQQNSSQSLFPVVQYSPYILNMMSQQQVNPNAQQLETAHNLGDGLDALQN
jgi:hypothetical protein